MGSLKRSAIRILLVVAVAGLAARSLGAQQPATSPAPRAGVIRLTLDDALQRARQNSVTYQAAVTDARLAHENQKQATAALLPSVNYNNSFIYTQGTGVDDQVRFIANNAVHEYISQGNVHEVLDVAGFAEARRASALAALARARQEIASRGLVVTVVETYYRAAAAEKKQEAAEEAADEGERFLQLTQNLEHGGEVARSDVIKAELQVNDRRRQLEEAKLALLNARLDVAVLIFPDFNDNFALVDDLHASPALPAFPEIQSSAAENNPDIRAALEVTNAAEHGVSAARAGYLPSLSLDYFYGIDAAHFAAKTDGVPNLGSSAVATLNIPVWNWGATQSKVRQAELQRDQAKRELSLTERKLLAELHAFYAEAQTAANELSNLDRSAQLGRESLRLTTLRYRNGESTVLEVVDAQNTATVSRTSYEDGALRYRIALANLETLTGVLTTP